MASPAAAFFQDQILADPFNKYCLDCKQKEVSFASVTFGIYICDVCAQAHKEKFGMAGSYVKNLYYEAWDDYQMSFFIPGVGGSKPFYDFMKTYDLHNDTIQDKYSSKPAQYYAV